MHERAYTLNVGRPYGRYDGSRHAGIVPRRTSGELQTMTSVKIDAQTLERLRTVSGPVQLCDDAGHVVGFFRAACGAQRYPEPPLLSPEELQRRLAAPNGRTISEILGDLERRQ